MKKLIEAVKQLKENFPLDTNYEWDIPKLPSNIKITFENDNKFKKTLELKQKLRNHFKNQNQLDPDNDWNLFLWIIKEWGGIKSFKDDENNKKRIQNFSKELSTGKLKGKSFNALPSLSKLASFLWPDKYSIYDSRAIYTLNWLIFCCTKDTPLFPQPTGRNTKLQNYNTILLYSVFERKFISEETAYFKYCELLRKLAQKVFNDENQPYLVEMLLFVAADEWVPDNIKKTIKIDLSNWRVDTWNTKKAIL